MKSIPLLALSLFVFWIVSSTAYGATATQSGNWSDSATWGGSPPSGNEEDVVIPMDVTVTLDTSDEVGEIRVMGKLTVATGTYELTCDSLIVMGANSELEIGTESERYSGDFTLTLKGEQPESFMHMGHDMGWRALLALNGGTLNLHGEDRVEWTRLDANVEAGSNSITMAEAVDWRPGDEIVLVSSTNDWNEAEELTVASVTGGGTVVNLTSNLSYWHCGTIQQYTRPSDGKTWTADMRAEVGLLTRNVTIQGASDSVATGTGAHIMVHGEDNGHMASGYAYIEGIEVFRGGQESILGRYPFHWHLVAGNGTGQYFNDSSVHDSTNRGITIHGTDHTTVSNNFIYNTIGHTLFLEDGVEENNVITYNVVCLTVRPAPGTEVTPSDNELNEAQNRTPASYWITHPNNTVDFNVAAGGEGTGFWYIFPNRRIGPSANLAYYDDATIADKAPLGSFNGNTTHSYMNGWDIFDGLDTDHSIAKNRGWNNATDHVFENALWYANETALYTGTGGQGNYFPVENVIKRNNVIVDNTNATMLASSTTIEESVFIARSGLPLNPEPRRIGHKLYDGAPDLNDCYFVGWDAPLPFTSFIQTVGGATQRLNWGFSGVETDHPGTNMTMRLHDFDFGDAWSADTQSMAHPRKWQNVLSDGDGSLTGLADSSLVANHPWYFTGSETLYAGSQNVYHAPHKFARITQRGQNRFGTHHIFTREKSGTPTETYFHVNGFEEHNSFAAIVNEDFEYSVTFWETQSYNPARWEMWDAEPGDVAIVKFNHMDSVNGLNPTGTSYNSVAEILSPSSTTTGHYLDGNGVLWFRVVATSASHQKFGFSWTSGSAAYLYNGSDDLDLDGRTNDQEGGPSRDTDGDGLPDYVDENNDSDGMSDKDELFYGLNPDDPADLRYEFGEHGGDGWWTVGNTVHRDNVDGAYEFVAGSSNQKHMQIAGLTDIALPGSDIDTITIRYKSDTSGNIRFLWWKASGGTSFVNGPAYTGGSGYVEETFNLSGNVNWAGQNITKMRVQGPAVEGAVTSVDWIRANGQGDLPIITLGFLDSMIADGVPGSLRGPEQDADGDGIQNLIEFVTRTDANDPMSFSNPKISVREIEDQYFLEATVQVDSNIDTHQSDVQFSVSLSFHTDFLAAELVSEVNVGDGSLVERTYRSSAPIEDAPQFARLVVSESGP